MARCVFNMFHHRSYSPRRLRSLFVNGSSFAETVHTFFSYFKSCFQESWIYLKQSPSKFVLLRAIHEDQTESFQPKIPLWCFCVSDLTPSLKKTSKMSILGYSLLSWPVQLLSALRGIGNVIGTLEPFVCVISEDWDRAGIVLHCWCLMDIPLFFANGWHGETDQRPDRDVSLKVRQDRFPEHRL